MFNLSTTKQFEKDYKLCKRRGLDMRIIEIVFELLAENGNVTAKYKPHKLQGDYADFWECHIQNDWLLIWLIDAEKKEIQLTRTGTHSDLF